MAESFAPFHPFTITRIPQILFGEGRFAEVPSLLSSFGRRALVVIGGRSFQNSTHWPHLLESMRDAGISWQETNVQGEPSPMLVDEAVRAHRDWGVDVVLAIGGGSVLDAAKAIAGLLPFGNSVIDHIEGVGRGVPYSGPATPVVAVPTTAGTGAEATKNAVLSIQGPDGFKKSFRHDALVPKVAVVDPVLTHTCPPDLTAASGMDAVTQLIESYVCTQANPFTDALVLSGLAAAKDGLFAAWEGQTEGRGAMAYAALLSGITLAQAGLGVVHGLASPLGGLFPIPHGVACGTLLAAATRSNIRALRERMPDSPALGKYARLGTLLGNSKPDSDEAAFDILVDTLSAWTERLRLPRLSAYGIRERDLSKLAAGYSAKTNPVALTEKELVEIMRERL